MSQKGIKEEPAKKSSYEGEVRPEAAEMVAEGPELLSEETAAETTAVADEAKP
jgi:hypothetical protein